ncbi:valine--tRNA ligase [Chloroflexota bacterium]
MAKSALMHDEMPKAYEPSRVEQKWYQFWLERDFFTAKIAPDKKPYVVIHPPTNITGDLHLGTALTATLEDIMIRWHRMLGESTLWLPGVDHAGIATQVVVERLLAKEGLDRHQLGRENFLDRVWQWARTYQANIIEQHRRLGASMDWKRLRFTMDEGPSRAVRTAFVRLYHKGLIYRGERIISWCPRCATALSDLEVEHQEMSGHLYYFHYHLADSKRDFITVATTRPETILGDTAIAVNPEDERFKSMIGKKAVVPTVGRKIPIIEDKAVEPTFGTGAVKITPAHDPVDFEIAQRHNLPFINILNPDTTMNENAGLYAGLDRFKCRDLIVADLKKDGLLEKIDSYVHSIAHCQRCQTVIEPIVSEQWFVKTGPLAKPAIRVVTNGDISIIPSHFAKVYLNWMSNIRDWCISRQLWWGHRIPVWYCRDCGEITVTVDDPKACHKCGLVNLEQDPDVLDTWFSSALWPYSTLGWPEDTEDLSYFYPTTVLETAYDILPFWVARMIMMGLEDTGRIPFQTVYLHGLIRDEKGEKMTKTRGNVINPLEIIDQYGTDALRFALSTGITPGNDSKLTKVKLEAGRNFANKLWNATRFVVRSIESEQTNIEIQWDLLPPEDLWILSRLSRTISSVTSLMDNFQFGEAQRQIYDFLWSEFCDWYIELAKVRLHPSEKEVLSPVPILVYALETSLRLLHPYMPFVTEELWQHLRRRLPSNWQNSESIMLASYPESDAKMVNPDVERVIESVIEIIRSIRNARAQHNVESVKWIESQIYGGKLTPTIAPYSQAIEILARARPVTFLDTRKVTSANKDTLVLVLKEIEIAIPMKSMVNIETERRRLDKEMQQSQAEVIRLEIRLNDSSFLTKAPVIVVNKERDKLGLLKNKLKRLQQQLTKLQV